MLKSRSIRAVIGNFFLSLIITYAFVAVGSYLFNGDEWFIPSLLILVAIWVLEWLIILKGVLVQSVVNLVRKGAIREQMIDHFHTAELPAGYTEFDSVDDFLSSVAANEDLPDKPRFSASSTLASLQTMRQVAPMSGLLTSLNLDAALLKFSRQRRSPPKRSDFRSHRHR